MHKSSAATLNRQMMIFGGRENQPVHTQISIVESCGLRRLGTLPMIFIQGACNIFQTSGGNEEVLLCFGYSKDGSAEKLRHR